MSLRIFCTNFFTPGKKWLTRLALAVLAAFVSAKVSLAFPEMRTENRGLVTGDWGLVTGKTPKIPLVSTTFSPITNSQQLLQQGRELFQAEQFSQAITVWQQAVSAFKASGDKLNEAQTLSYLSLAYQQLGKWQEAEEAIASSLSLIRNSKLKNQDSGLILAQALNTQGHLELALGRAEQALSIWQQAAAIYSQIKDTEGIIGSQINQAQAMQSLGLYRRARNTLEQLENSLQSQSNSLLKATGLRSLGNALRVIGDLEKSRELLQQSLQIAQDLRSSAAISAAHFSLGNIARALAKRAEESQDITTANTETKTAINAYEEATKLSTSPKMRLQAQLNHLSLLVENKQFAEASSMLSQIQLNELPPSRRTVYAQINLVQTLMKLGQRKENQLPITNYQYISQLLAKAVQQSRSIKDQQAESYALGNLGELYQLTGQSKEAQNLTQQALILAQSINASDIAYRWQWQLGKLLKNQGEKKQAIAAYTTAVETLKSLRSDLVAINPENPDVQFSFRESVEPVYRELVDLLLSTEGEQNQENLRQARQVIESLQLAELDNFFQEACLDAKPVQIDKLDSAAAVIYPIILPERLGVILALPQSPLRYYATLQPQPEIENLLNDLQQDIGRLTANNQQVLRLSQQVYDWIIRPAEAELKKSNVQILVFVLDGLLRNIPMGALHDGQQYLIEKYSIALTPGLQLLPPQPFTQNRIQVLTVGLSEARQGFSALPNVERELNEIEKQVNSHKLLNQQFTENNLEKALNSVPFPVVHIATHGQFSSQAQNTFILTWDDKINVRELDNLLRRREQKESRPIELLVFSACETAEGDSRAALGLAGVAVRAGARSTLATLWKVSDESTATLMVRFYQELARGSVTKAEALRRAQLSLLQDRRYRLPYFWAPYVLVGNWR